MEITFESILRVGLLDFILFFPSWSDYLLCIWSKNPEDEHISRKYMHYTMVKRHCFPPNFAYSGVCDLVVNSQLVWGSKALS